MKGRSGNSGGDVNRKEWKRSDREGKGREKMDRKERDEKGTNMGREGERGQ